MITRLIVTSIEAKKNIDKKSTNFEVFFNIEDVKVEDDAINVKFNYRAKYNNDGGHIAIKGELSAKENKETIKKIQAGLKDKMFPPEYLQRIINTINYFGSSNATVVASVINLIPPIKLPVLKLNQKKTNNKNSTSVSA